MRSTRYFSRLLSLSVCLALMLSLLPGYNVQAVSTSVVISQVYGGGGNTGATYKNDFIELYNLGTSSVDLTDWTVQYASSAGTTWQKTVLSGTIEPGHYYLIQEAAGTGGTVNLPTPNVIGTIPMSGTAGKVALASNSTTLTGACPTGLIDFVGFGTATNCSETTPTANLSNTTAALRNGNGATDTDNNSADFTIGAPNPRNTPPLDSAPTVSSTVPANSAADVALNSAVTVTFSEAVDVTGSWFTLSCSTSGSHSAAVSGGPTAFTLTPDSAFVGNETCTLTVLAANVTDQDAIDPPDSMTSNYTASFTTLLTVIQIHDIQGGGHVSLKTGQTVKTQGIVTALRTTGSTRGFYLQAAESDYDADPATSEGVFVFTGSTSDPASLVTVGDLVTVAAAVSEYRGAAASLTLTELTAPVITVISSANTLPAPVVLGAGGRIPPSTVIEDDATGSVETTGTFDPATDGIDFYESLEGMLVQVNNAVAVGPQSNFTSNHEIPVVGDNGALAGVRTSRGGVVAQASDFNPERIILNDWISGGPTLPAANVGDLFPGATLGVIDYSFNNFKLQVISMPSLISGGLTQETAGEAGLNQISVAAFNVENLAPTDPAAKFTTLANLIINNLKAPDILSIEEIQDNTGVTDDGVVDAATTWNMLITAITTSGGPTYQFRQIDPVNDQDGGATGGNIRVGFLFRTDRGLSFVDRPGATPTTANGVTGTGLNTQLLYSPGRIDPTNTAFSTSRKPLAGEFLFNGHHLFVIANHWNSKGGDQPLFGVTQPPVFSSEIQRNQQATVVHNFVNDILTADPNAGILVMGDLNDFQFSTALATLKGSPAILTDLIETLPLAERYSYVYEGNSETLDHILASAALTARPYVYDVVHVNSEFANQASDHEPQTMLVTLNDPPTVDAGGPYSMDEGSSITLSATGTDLEGGALTYAWDLDNNGTFEAAGKSVSFSRSDGPASYTVKVRTTDNGGLTAVASATVTVNNVVPTVNVPTFSSEPSLLSKMVTAQATFTDPDGAGDATFTCTVNYGDGTGDQAGTVNKSSCTGPAHQYAGIGNYTVTITITDKDGGAGTKSGLHAVVQYGYWYFPIIAGPGQ